MPTLLHMVTILKCQSIRSFLNSEVAGSTTGTGKAVPAVEVEAVTPVEVDGPDLATEADLKLLGRLPPLESKSEP